MRSSYIINEYFMYMKGHYDRHGKLCTHVTETCNTFIVDKSPLEILEDSICVIGYDLRGAIATSKKLLGNIYHCPILVNPILRIIVFPTKSAWHDECVWYNPIHIKRTNSLNRKTTITYSNGKTHNISAKLTSFNSKIKTAEQLDDITKVSAYPSTSRSNHSLVSEKKDDYT
ncbi:competence protein ComK [Bacillus sp. FJAT-29937]|uniref:competence protein ComK n=1 Tax=Bacillus sp. FJAT-29937 TaxID=1720553 RepID=UPI001E45DD20|nr:competence protein ComK [Bacillus sp. FJAT-29937]